MAVDFWFSIGSTYSYLSVMRVPDVARETGIHFTWRPFNVRAIMREMGNIPFADKPAKLAYMWTDVGRRARRYGLTPVLPAPYPLPELERANRVAVLAATEGWCEPYVRESYRLWFEQGQAAGSEPNVSASIAAAGHNPIETLARAEAPEAIAALAAATNEAKTLGIFGAPTFVVAGELFWGDDRLEDALEGHG